MDQFMNKSIRIINILKEPLLHFLLIGVVLFLIFDWKGTPATLPEGQALPEAKIVVTREAISQVVDQFRKTWQRSPSKEETDALVEDLVRSEIYYREAIAMGLDRDDTVMKRRLRQKMEFILEDITTGMEPTDADLTAFMKKYPDRYLVDPQLSFRQVYVNADKRGKNAEADARQILAQLTAGIDPETVGDLFLLEPAIRLYPLWDINKLYGEQFGRSLLGLKPGKWVGPVRSGYGLHLVFVDKRVGGRLPALKEVRETVQRDLLVERQKELKDAAYAKIRGRYAVTVEGPKPETAAATAPTVPKGVAR